MKTNSENDGLTDYPKLLNTVMSFYIKKDSPEVKAKKVAALVASIERGKKLIKQHKP